MILPFSLRGILFKKKEVGQGLNKFDRQNDVCLLCIANYWGKKSSLNKIEFLNPSFSFFLLFLSPSFATNVNQSFQLLPLIRCIRIFIYLKKKYYNIFGNLAKERLNWHQVGKNGCATTDEAIDFESIRIM